MLGSMALMGSWVRSTTLSASASTNGPSSVAAASMADRDANHNTASTWSPTFTARRPLIAEADLWLQRLGPALPPVDLEEAAGLPGTHIDLSETCLSYISAHQARPSDQRLHQSDDQFLQTPGGRAMKPPCYSPFARTRRLSCRIPTPPS